MLDTKDSVQGEEKVLLLEARTTYSGVLGTKRWADGIVIVVSGDKR